jgi:hypothetical protein
MSGNLDDVLQAKGADSDVLMQAARYYMAERCDDLSNDEMLEEMVAQAGDENKVRSELAKLADDPAHLEAAALAVLHWAWDDPAERPRVERAIDGAKGKLPVIEVAILAMVTLYGMYLFTTGGKKKETKKGGVDGSLQESIIEYYPHPLESVVNLFRRGKKS